MKKKIVHIISHSHWDREWYLPYEQHHMRLVQLIDDLLELFETDPDFDSFHLDGQTITIEDYLQVRPENEGKIRQAIADGKLKIGPFYILQDDFLISSEANVRNMIIGEEDCQKWGKKVALGYFPDTFGNMGQTAQILKKANLETAAFGRGIRPTGFNNMVAEDEEFSSQFSELLWESPDKSQVLGILFANWYSNGNEIPSVRDEALTYWTKKLADVEKFASTKHLLMMNGVDHQPVQKDLSKAIKLANELFPNYHFIHSSFDRYIEAVHQEVPDTLATIEGELTSQETDGWYTLANTASSRIYLKQMHTKVSRQLENIAEPLATMASELTDYEYPHDQLRYAWKLLLQNAPHDSICGCSVDEVHAEMITRYQKALEVAKFISEKAQTALVNAIDSSYFEDGAVPFTVFNTSGLERKNVLEAKVELKRFEFNGNIPKTVYQKAKDYIAGLKDLVVVDKDGKVYDAMISKPSIKFNYELPERAFRIPYFGVYVTVELPIKQAAMSWDTFAVTTREDAEKSAKPALFNEATTTLENDFLTVVIEANGLLNVTDKLSGRKYHNLLQFEDTGDIGNEYIYRQAHNDTARFAHDGKTTLTVLENNHLQAKIELQQTFEVPVSADSLLTTEQNMVIDITERLAERSTTTTPWTLTTVITMAHNSPQLHFTTSFDNQMTDHRLRVLFPTKIETDVNYADSIYEVVERPNKPNMKFWKNPTNPQHQRAFVSLLKDDYGVTIGNYGLNEYEIVEQDKTIAVTLLRCVGELGDWGYFETKEAQCIGKHTVEFTFESFTPETKFASYIRAKQQQVPLQYQTNPRHQAKLASQHAFCTINSDGCYLTALKRNTKTNQIVTRGFNLSNTLAHYLSIDMPNYEGFVCNLLEEDLNRKATETFNPGEIKSHIWRKK
ncbi:alpha-mannosidase [Granulicatella balaenopterae]|uniref:Alpha-mannosidase n=1 Tax=Granulicatella balaenopterae TaxID=137733 RepID=A0A1H9KDY5_9LACT|nr:alpha-mannosidase [Granulicatella balaenopterae]SEQ97322.1 alpha-mannosidase [Granulicatella balaenopterae]